MAVRNILIGFSQIGTIVFGFYLYINVLSGLQLYSVKLTKSVSQLDDI